MTNDPLFNRTSSALYLLCAALLVVLAVQNYRHGLYPLVYSASLLALFFACMAAYLRYAPELKHAVPLNRTLLGLTLLTILWDASIHYVTALYWIYPLALLSFIALPMHQAIRCNALTLALTAPIALWREGVVYALNFATIHLFLCSVAIVFAQIHQRSSRKLVELEIRDPLTGAYNMRHLEDTLAKEICRADRTGRPLSLIALEIDYLQQIIELHGNSQVNTLFQQLSESLRATIRAGDSQYCNDEHTFYLMLPCTPSEGLLVIAERIRRTIEESAWPVVDSITVSVGCTSYKSGERTSSGERMINEAQLAMREAQKNGHNRVCHHSA
jgi:diguanylate cyclase (GGDEF)-like protein